MHLIRKILAALKDSPRAFRPSDHPTLVMTLLVKNEEDMLEANLRFHKSMGVDGFIVTDNNSTDRTPDILRRYVEMGWVKHVIHEPATNYNQKVWVDRMVCYAKDVLHADWVINADADELWYTPSGNLKDELCGTRANVLRCPLRYMYPEEGKPFWQWTQAIRPIMDPVRYKAYGLSRYSLFAYWRGKVMHRTRGYVQISTGNHKVLMLPRRERQSRITIYHYSFQSKARFVEKIENGGRQLEQNPHKHIGVHWRYFYELYKAGELEAEYDRIIGANVYPQLVADGFIVPDDTMFRYISACLAENPDTPTP